MTEYRTDLDRAYDAVASHRLQVYDHWLSQTYQTHMLSTYTEYQSDLDQTYEQLVTERLTTLQNRLDSARAQYDERREHRQQTDAYQRQRRLLIGALLVLGLAVIALAAYIVLL